MQVVMLEVGFWYSCYARLIILFIIVSLAEIVNGLRLLSALLRSNCPCKKICIYYNHIITSVYLNIHAEGPNKLQVCNPVA
jgi:hypothetical protein